jgi:hypothetical protein
VPKHTAGFKLQSIRVHIRDHKLRELPRAARSLEAYYGGFCVAQSWKGVAEARRWAMDVAYGQSPREIRIARHRGRLYELGPEPEPGDIDGRRPAVVTWHDGDMFYLVASGEMPAERLVRIAQSLYGAEEHPRRRGSAPAARPADD